MVEQHNIKLESAEASSGEVKTEIHPNQVKLKIKVSDLSCAMH